MTFKAEGKLMSPEPSIIRKIKKWHLIPAMMSEGFFGKNHKILIQMDKKMSKDIWKKLDMATSNMDDPDAVYLNAMSNPKKLNEHKITIIIE